MFALTVAPTAKASSNCASVLTERQLRDLAAMIVTAPSRPYSPGLGDADDGDGVQGSVKRLTSSESERSTASSKPRIVAVRNVLSEQVIAPLKDWLKSNPPADVPAW